MHCCNLGQPVNDRKYIITEIKGIQELKYPPWRIQALKKEGHNQIR